jgi:hypothetical protein
VGEKEMKKVELKQRMVNVGILNFKIHSKKAEKYVRLFESLSAVQHVKVRGSEFGTIGYVKRLEKKFLVGEIYLFLNIDPNAPWWDAEKRAPIESDALGMETKIFERLKPHLKQKSYLFDLRNHRLYFDCDGFNPLATRRFFERLFQEAGLLEQLGEFDIEIHSSKESIDQILKTPNMTLLEIYISVPNPEDLSEAEQAIYQELQAEGTLKFREIRKSTQKIGIKPNERTANLVRLSRTEGYSRSLGFSEGQPISSFTQEHPEIISESYSILREKPTDALLRVADSIYNRLADV